jgi:dienelactone hydrolase
MAGTRNEPPKETPDWVRRFTATSVSFPVWSQAAPDRLGAITTRSGASQAWGHDHSNGAWHQLSFEPVGVEEVVALPDGRFAWWHDPTGSEAGHLVAVPFEGGDPEPVFPEVQDGWMMGLSFTAERGAVAIAQRDGYRIYITRDGDTHVVYESSTPAGIGREWPINNGGLSADGSLLCIRHTEHGSILHHALRVLDAATGDPVGELLDPGRNLNPVAWSPVRGDRRLCFVSERGPVERPAIWDLATGARTDLAVDLPGAVFPVAWFPEGDVMIVQHEHEGQAELHRLDPATGGLELIIAPGGDIDETSVRPDGRVWLRTSDGRRPPRIIDNDGEEVLPNPDEQPPEGRPYRSIWSENAHGDRVQCFVATPDGDGPFPLVFSVHGGPEWHERDAFDPETQAFVDAGYAVALPNYRGSTGYGIAFREALIGNVCFTETEDLLACLDTLVADGVADPDRVFWSGWSWGGCLACFNAGVNPDRWRAIFAGIPAGDFVAAHWSSAPALQAWDEAVFGGSPKEVPDAYRRSDPMTYVGSVRAPVLVIAGEADSRCPIEGVTPWVDAVRANGGSVDVHLYPAGHHANATEARVQHMQLILDFFDRFR